MATPVLVLVAIILNLREDDRQPEGDDVEIPALVAVRARARRRRRTVTGLVLFIVPSLLIDAWAWDVTPLTARVVGAVLTLPGMVNVWMLWDDRWSAFRRVFQAQLVSLACILVAHRGAVRRSRVGPAQCVAVRRRHRRLGDRLRRVLRLARAPRPA